MVYYTGTDVFVPGDELLSTVTPSKSSCLCNGPETLSMIEMSDTSTIQQHKNAHTASATTERRYERKRELHVIRLPNGGLTDMHGTPIVVDPPHNAPLPVPVVNPAHRRGGTIRQESQDSLETNRRRISAVARRTPRPMMARSSGHAKSKSSAFRQSLKIKLAPLKTATPSSNARNRQGEHSSVEGNPLLRGSNGRLISNKKHSATTKKSLIIKLKLK